MFLQETHICAHKAKVLLLNSSKKDNRLYETQCCHFYTANKQISLHLRNGETIVQKHTQIHTV